MVAHLKTVYAAPAEPGSRPPRLVTRGDGMRLRALTAALPSGRLAGAKLMASSRTKRTAYLIALFDQEEGGIVALMDGNAITACRTAATSALAIDCLVPVDHHRLRLGILGSGTEARAHLLATAAIRRPSEILVFSPSTENRAAFAAEFAGRLAIPCRSVASPEAVLAGCDLLVAAARSRDETPIFRGAELRDGTTVISIGSTLPEQREIDSETIARCSLIVADEPEEVAHRTGDFIAAREAGIAFEGKLASLSDLVMGKLEARRAASCLTMFKSVGAGIQDIATAEFVFDRASAIGLAAELPLELAIKRGGGENRWF
jgi:ornithine cyclodeaminase/alanine dehydrogenase